MPLYAGRASAQRIAAHRARKRHVSGWVMTRARLRPRPGRSFSAAVHVTSDEVLTWNQVVETIARVVGSRAPRCISPPNSSLGSRPIGCGLLGDKVHSMAFDNSKISDAWCLAFAVRSRLKKALRKPSPTWISSGNRSPIAHPRWKKSDAGTRGFHDFLFIRIGGGCHAKISSAHREVFLHFPSCG